MGMLLKRHRKTAPESLDAPKVEAPKEELKPKGKKKIQDK